MSTISDRPVCGAHYFTTWWLEHWFGIRDPMGPACRVHDSAYDEHIATPGGTHKSSKRIDIKFWKDMSRLIRWQKNPLIKVVMHIQRPLYYGLVRVYGILRWSRKAGV